MCQCECESQQGEQPDDKHQTKTTQSELQVIMEASGWEEYHSELGKTVFRPEDEDKRQNSIFIASKGLHNPHAMPSDHARFVVEAIGPDITGGSSEWEYYDNHKLALSQVAEFMKRYISDEEFEENLREIVPWMD